MRINKCMSFRERFEAQYEPVTESGCWIWNTSLTIWGYGRIKDRGVTYGAHRAAYLLHVGPIPDGMQVCHKCDVPCCVNPAHLFLGTMRENNDDKIRKGRARYPGNNGSARGEKSGVSVFSAADVLAIRASSKPQNALAAEYGVSTSAINHVVNRRTWKHI